MEEDLKRRYREILEIYLRRGNEEELYKTSLLSKELIKRHIDPDEIVATHFEILNEIIKNMPPGQMYRAYNNASTVLLELMMRYAIAYHEYIDMHKRLYLKEREINEFLELFIDILAHDLKNPLFIISGYIEVIGEVCSGVTEYIDKIRKAIDKIQKLLEDAKIYSKVRAVEPELKPVDLATILNEVITELKSKSMEKRILINLDYDPKLKYEVKGSQFLIHAFLNIVDNAIKYSPEGSTVEISITDQGDEWKTCVKDQGEGVPDKFKKRIFNRFTRGVEGGIKGSGLGLAIAKAVVMQSRGKIWVEDNPEGGAVFCISLPKWK
ncbi:MAG: ATP-binding protein [Candidatus Methanospirareceae archaeon]